METRILRGTKSHLLSGFFYPKVVERSISFGELRDSLRSCYPWSSADAVEMKYFNTSEQRFLPLTCEEHLGFLFGLDGGSRFGKIHIDVLQPRKEQDKGKGVQTSFVSANSERPRTPCRSRPSKPTGSESQNTTVVDVEDDAEPDEAVPRLDDEDELMYPELVDKFSQQAMEDEYTEDPSFTARFDDTDDEEKEENIESFIGDEYDGEDMPAIEWDRENPQLTPGTIFQSMVDCRNALTTYCILSENDFVIDKSEPNRFSVHCPYERCRWRLHASRMRKSKLIQVLPLIVYFRSLCNVSFCF